MRPLANPPTARPESPAPRHAAVSMMTLAAALITLVSTTPAAARPTEPDPAATGEDVPAFEPSTDAPSPSLKPRLTHAPFDEADRRALRRLGQSLPAHGLLPIAAPTDDADEAWARYGRKLIAIFAPDTLKAADRRALIDVRPLAPVLETLIPRHRRYVALQELLALYATRMGLTPQPIPETPYKVKVGLTAPEVGLLRDRLRAEGYGDEGVTGKLRDYFDERLKRALQTWQRDHALPTTLVIDPLTRRRLNAPIRQPVAEVAVALARFRALSLRRDEGRHIIVHVNAFGLVAERDGQPELAMPVVVGRNTEKDQTPMLSTSLEMVTVNPTWVVPQRLVDERLRVEVKDIPELLIDKGYAVQVDDNGRWRVRMPPGPDNPLGRLKFVLADTLGVYLHDTNARSAFSKDTRALSAGCIRLLDPTALGTWVLGDRAQLLNEALAQSATSSFPVEGLEVHLVYQTALAENGRLVRHPDIYGRDPALLAAIDPDALAEARRSLAPQR